MNIAAPKKIGFLFVVIHLVIFFWFLSYLKRLSGIDGQGPLLWFYWLIIDFPVSLVVVLFFAVDITSRYVMYFTHGFLGTIWWFFVPMVACKCIKIISFK
jgi:hypothetical protein